MSTLALVFLPTTCDLHIYQGDDDTFTLTVTNPDGTAADLSGAVIEAQVRQTAASSTVLGSLVTSVAGNVITLTLPNSLTSTLSGNAVWDCQMTNGGLVTTLAAGEVDITAEVTRP